MKNNFIAIILVVFAVLSAVLYAVSNTHPEFSFPVMEAGNGLMALLSLTSYFMVRRQMAANPQAFVRGVSGATFLKLTVCLAAILIYALANRSHLHKPTLFVLFGIYAAYTVVETLLLQKLARGAK